MSVYAIDRHRHPIGGLADLEELPGFAAGVPVVAFDLPASVRVEEFVAEAFQRISVRLVSRAVTGQSLRVSDRQRLEALVP